MPVAPGVDLTADAVLQAFDFGALFAMASVHVVPLGARRRE